MFTQRRTTSNLGADSIPVHEQYQTGAAGSNNLFQNALCPCDLEGKPARRADTASFYVQRIALMNQASSLRQMGCGRYLA